MRGASKFSLRRMSCQARVACSSQRRKQLLRPHGWHQRSHGLRVIHPPMVSRDMARRKSRRFRGLPIRRPESAEGRYLGAPAPAATEGGPRAPAPRCGAVHGQTHLPAPFRGRGAWLRPHAELRPPVVQSPPACGRTRRGSPTRLTAWTVADAPLRRHPAACPLSLPACVRGAVSGAPSTRGSAQNQALRPCVIRPGCCLPSTLICSDHLRVCDLHEHLCALLWVEGGVPCVSHLHSWPRGRRPLSGVREKMAWGGSRWMRARRTAGGEGAAQRRQSRPP